MKRTRHSSRERISREAVELGRLAEGLAQSGGKLEDAYWESRLATTIDRLLEDGAEDDLSAALDRLFEDQPRAHDELADMIESRAEATRLSHEGKSWDVLLVTVPILVWSRFSIPSAPIPRQTLTDLGVQFAAHFLARDARFTLADFLFSPDQLPRTFTDTWRLTRELGVAAVGQRQVRLDAGEMPETNRFLADIRFLVGAVAVPQGSAIFRWHESDGDRDSALAAWTAQAGPTLEPMLAGCSFQPLIVDAYHSACRNSDREIRPYSVKASVAFLQATLGLAPDQLRAVFGPFYDRRLEEYRIGFGPLDEDEVYHGVVWPLLGAEDENSELPAEIEAVLADCGVQEIVALDQRFPFEFCDECGVPLYPNAEGEPVHAEMPEQTTDAPRVLH